MQILDLGPYDGILGYDWLMAHSPMQCDWVTRTLSFDHKGSSIQLHGVQSMGPHLSLVSSSQVVKWDRGNDIWTCVLLNCSSPDNGERSPSDAAVAPLLVQYQDLFQSPSALPPSRIYDHTIPLVPGAVPVNSRPYRYSPLQKSEIEKQVTELLSAGLITQSTSPFASPVLLVQKKDST